MSRNNGRDDLKLEALAVAAGTLAVLVVLALASALDGWLGGVR